MTKTSQFSAVTNDAGTVKAAAVSAVNKVLGILNEIIRKTVSSELLSSVKVLNRYINKNRV